MEVACQSNGNGHSIIELATKIEPEEEPEQLGSVTHSQDGEVGTGLQIRSSARVSKKMRLDLITNLPNAEKNAPPEVKESNSKHDEPTTPMPSMSMRNLDSCAKPTPRRRHWELWSVEDKDTFFEALNEVGKDFDAMQNHFLVKGKKKGISEHLIKHRDQIRHFYYRTWHKVSKHLKFSEDVKKSTQEIYSLVNYGEMRKRLGCVTEKMCIKLNELIHKGYTQLRIKGKFCRIKTPLCRIMRKINHVDDAQEILKLPSRICVNLRPRTNGAWSRVQATSHNPRIRMMVPLQKRLSSLLNFLCKTWRSPDRKLRDKLAATVAEHNEPVAEIVDPLLRIAPKPGTAICLPSINLSEYLTRTNISLNSYSERVKLYPHLTYNFIKGKPKVMRRPRNESAASEKKAAAAAATAAAAAAALAPPPAEKLCNGDNACDHTVADMLHGGKMDQGLLTVSAEALAAEKAAEAKRVKSAASDEIVAKVRAGWTIEDAHAVTMGELYLMFGKDQKVYLDYWWDEPEVSMSETLTTLLSVAKLSLRKARIQCPCGHICAGPAKPRPFNAAPQRIIRPNPDTTHSHVNGQPTVDKDGVFVRPLAPGSIEAFKAQLDRFRPRFCNRRGRPIRSKSIIIPRMLPLLPKCPPGVTGTVPIPAVPAKTAPSPPSTAGVRPISVAVGAPRLTPTITQSHDQGSITTPKDSSSLDTPVSSPPSISNLLGLAGVEDISLSASNFVGLLPHDAAMRTPPTSPSRILKETDTQWLNSEVSDFSLSSFLGHLDSPLKPEASSSRLSDVDSTLHCLMTENSVDYMAKFADLAAQMVSDSVSKK